MADSDLQKAVDAALTSEAGKPASLAIDGMSVSNRDPRALIELDKYAARKNGHRFGFAMRQMIPPGH